MTSMPDDSKRPIAQISIDTRILIEHLGKAQIGDIFTYADLSKLLGRDVQTIARHNLMSACRNLLSSGMVFGTIRSHGIKLLTDSERVGEGEAGITKVRRCARRAVNRLRFNEFNSLAPEDKTRVLTAQSVLGATVAFTKATAIKRISESVQATTLPVAKTMELFIGNEK